MQNPAKNPDKLRKISRHMQVAASSKLKPKPKKHTSLERRLSVFSETCKCAYMM